MKVDGLNMISGDSAKVQRVMEECKTFSELRLLIQYVDELLAKCDQIHQLWRFAASIALITLCFNTVTRIAKMRKFLNPAALFANKNKQ